MKTSISISRLTKNLLTLICIVLLNSELVAQNVLPIHIRENITLLPGEYTVKETCYIKKGVTLTIENGTALIFEPNATIRIDGGLKITGEPNKLVNITSRLKKSPGNGFVINGVSTNQSVDISYARFDYIKKPISFEFRWSRSNVNFSNNVIRRSYYEGAAVEIKEIDNLLTESKILFNFTDNTFSNSTSSLLFSNITSDLLTINLKNNVITRNEYTGRSRNGLFTSPLYMTYNKYQNNDVPNIRNNSIFDNFYSLYYEDTFDIGRTNISVIGNADKLDLSNNYFGKPEQREIEETFDFISANYQAPFLFTDDILNTPSSELNGHFHEVLIDGNLLDEKMMFPSYNNDIKSIEMRFNRPVINSENYGLVYTYISGDTVAVRDIKTELKWSEGNQVVKINVLEKFKKYGEKGYLELDGFYDNEGKNVPLLTLGKKALEDRKLKAFVPKGINPMNAGKSNEETIEVKDSNFAKDIIDKFKNLNDSFVHMKKAYWDCGVFVGNSLYFGDLNHTLIGLDPRRATPALGLRLGYQFTEKLKVTLNNNYVRISGSDQALDEFGNPRGTNFERNLSFRTDIVNLNMLLDYNLNKFKLKSTIVASVHGGISGYYFNPQAQMPGDDKWHDLRTIGTAGQTISTTDDFDPYEKFMIGIPVGASIKRHVSQRTIISLSYTYFKLFTDYLDDAATDLYPNGAAVAAANSKNESGYAAVYLSNPGNQPQTAQRTYSDNNDGYGYWGVSAIFKIYK